MHPESMAPSWLAALTRKVAPLHWYPAGYHLRDAKRAGLAFATSTAAVLGEGKGYVVSG